MSVVEETVEVPETKVLSLPKIRGQLLKGSLVVITIDPRSYRSLMTWNRRSAPVLSIGK